MQGDGSLDAFDDEHLKRSLHPADGFRAVTPLNDQLGDQRIVVRRDDSIGISGGVHAHSGSARRLKGRNASRRRHERVGVLRIDAAFNRVSRREDGPGSIFHFFARGDANLRLDQVHAGHQLSHRMLHLDARIHLNEVQ